MSMLTVVVRPGENGAKGMRGAKMCSSYTARIEIQTGSHLDNYPISDLLSPEPRTAVVPSKRAHTLVFKLHAKLLGGTHSQGHNLEREPSGQAGRERRRR